MKKKPSAEHLETVVSIIRVCHYTNLHSLRGEYIRDYMYLLNPKQKTVILELSEHDIIQNNSLGQ